MIGGFMRRALLFASTLVILFGLLALPSLADKTIPTKHTAPSLEASSRFSTQLTFTPSFTAYVPIVLNEPGVQNAPNGLEITNLIYSGADEYVEIRNNGSGSQSLNGWQIVSVRGSQTFDFPNGIILGVNQTLRVHSGPGAINNPPGDLFWSTAFLWNNDGDKAELRDDQGIVRDTSCYLDGCP
jgi:hypothetical protein